MEKTCENCKYWSDDRECRKNPPKGYGINRFPTAYSDDFCGEFKKKPLIEIKVEERIAKE